MKDITLRYKQDCHVDEIKRYLGGYDSALSVYKGNFKANWLVNDIYDHEWITVTDRTIVLDSESQNYQYSNKVYWDRLLPNGNVLTDPKYSAFLKFLQKILFCYIESPFLGPTYSKAVVLGTSSQLINFVCWLCLNESVFQPAEKFFTNVKSKDLEIYVQEWAMGGSFLQLRTGERIIEKINDLSGLSISSEDPLRLNESDIISIIDFLKDINCYRLTNYGKKIVDRKKLRDLCSISKQELYSHASILFLRQFEPEIKKINNKVLFPLKLSTEYPSHKTPLIDEIRNKRYSIRRIRPFLCFLEDIVKMKRLFKNHLPDPQTFSLRKVRFLANKECMRDGTTPWIPLSICLNLINRSIDIIINHGDNILDYIEVLIPEMKRSNLLRGSNANYDSKCRKVRRLLPDNLKQFGIETLNPKTDWTGFDGRTGSQILRENPSVKELLDILQAACLIMIAGLKPIRVDELSSLRYDCLYFKEGDGYWLSQSLKKSGINGFLPETDKPIPWITAKAIQILKRFNEISRNLKDTKNAKPFEYLLCNWSLGSTDSTCTNKTPEAITTLIAKFCDYINVEIDGYGRRWYANVHEFRKSFLLTFFWTFKYSSLDACRWIAGHKDSEHVLRYIESNMPGEELVEVESEYVYRQLRMFAGDCSFQKLENIEELHEDVCKQFSVLSVSEISEEELNEWISLAIKKGIYNIEVIGLDHVETDISVRIAFRVKDKGRV